MMMMMMNHEGFNVGIYDGCNFKDAHETINLSWFDLSEMDDQNNHAFKND